MNAETLQVLNDRRLNLLKYCIFQRRIDFAERLNATKKLFDRKVYAVDLHNHSTFSDGRATVQENYEAAMRCGLDFIFMTDHNSLGQKRCIKSYNNASWGQEPGAGLHHLGLLKPVKKFTPKGKDIKTDFDRARKLAPFVWIPHPAGWYHRTWYNDEQIASLWNLGNEFAIEVMNGAARIETAYDAFDAKAVTIWDRLLADGRKITALGGSDAHTAEMIGTVWTGVFAKTGTADSIIKALNCGHCFASESALIDFSIDGSPMGSTLRKPAGASVELAFTAADSDGLAKVEIVSGGAVIDEVTDYGSQIIRGKIRRKVTARPAYYRFQVISADKRRAFSTPVYVEPA